MTREEAIKYLGVDICEFDDECDYCDSPEGGSYVSISVSECGTETNYYICGKCVIGEAEKQKAGDDAYCKAMEAEIDKETK